MPDYKSDEFFVQHPDGTRTDAELHEPILAEGDVATAKNVTREFLRSRGWSDADIEVLLAEPPPDQISSR